MEWGWDNLRALIGIIVLVAIAWALSERKKSFPVKVVVGAIGLQFAFALLFFGVPKLFGFHSLFGQGEGANPIIATLQDATLKGTSFVFGYVGDAGSFPVEGQAKAPIFFFQLLPMIIVVASLSAILWHWRILRYVTRFFAMVFSRTMGLSGATSLAVSANVFMGMTEAPILVRPYIKNMSRSEIFILMTTGFATIAGSVLVLYVTMLQGVMDNALPQLLAASFMAAPAAVALALTMVPEENKADAEAEEPVFEYQSTMDAFAKGATDGLAVVFNIATMLIAALALLHIVNVGLASLPDVGGASLSLERILGWIFSPLMYAIGIPLEEATRAGSLMGVKTVLTEFIAFDRLSQVSATELSDRSRIILAHAICGFANFGSMGILIGGLSIIEPLKRNVFLELAWKTLIAGTLATCLSGAVVAALPASLFVQ